MEMSEFVKLALDEKLIDNKGSRAVNSVSTTPIRGRLSVTLPGQKPIE